MNSSIKPSLLILNQMAGPLTWEFAIDYGKKHGPVALLTGHADTLEKNDEPAVRLQKAPVYRRGNLFTRTFSWIRYLLCASRWLWQQSPEIPVLIYSNPPMLCWLAALSCSLRKQRFSVMVHDIYPAFLVRMGVLSSRNPIVWVWNTMNRWAYEQASMVLTLGERMAEELNQQFDASITSNGSIQIVYPWVDTTQIRPRSKMGNPFAMEHGLVGKTVFIYSGNMGLGHDIESILDAASYLENHPEVVILLIGAGPKWEMAKERLEHHPMPNVRILPWQPEDQVPLTFASADVAFITLEDALAGLAIPSKSFSALAAGLPLLLICGGPTELGLLVDRFQCGWVVPAGRPEMIRDVILNNLADPKRLEEMKINSRRASETIGSRANSHRMVALVRQGLEGAPDDLN